MNKTHGMTDTREYASWVRMIERCYSPGNNRHERYGGRGITVCDAWRHSFEQFFKDMGPRPVGHSIERKDNNGNYCPANCIWIPKGRQAFNRGNTVLITFRGETHCLTEWARHVPIPLLALRARRQSGWSDEDILTRPHRANVRATFQKSKL